MMTLTGFIGRKNENTYRASVCCQFQSGRETGRGGESVV